MKILHAKKCTLFPFAHCDEEDWRKMLEAEGALLGAGYFADFEGFYHYTLTQIRMGLWQAWAIETNNLGRERNRKIGFVVLSDYKPKLKSVSVQGLLNKEIMKGLIPLLKIEGKTTYAENSLRAVLNFCFNDFDIHRVEAQCFECNNIARRLVEKVGFKKEGKLIDAGMIKEQYEHLIIYGLIKEQ